MFHCLGGIFEFPWIALLFVMAHWKTGVAVAWGLGFAFVLFRSMRRWYREDAKAAQVLSHDDGEIYDNMKIIARDHRGSRLKYILTEGLFWLPLLAWRGGRKLASIVFYPILVVMDRAQKDAIEEARKKASLGVVVITDEEKPVVPPPGGTMPEEVRCSKCGLVGVHACITAPAPIVPTPSAAALAECSKCGAFMKVGSVHRCATESDPCPECGRPMIVDAVHACSARKETEADESDEEEVYCKECDTSFYPSEEAHTVKRCEECRKRHCQHAGCA